MMYSRVYSSSKADKGRGPECAFDGRPAEEGSRWAVSKPYGSENGVGVSTEGSKQEKGEEEEAAGGRKNEWIQVDLGVR